MSLYNKTLAQVKKINFNNITGIYTIISKVMFVFHAEAFEVVLISIMSKFYIRLVRDIHFFFTITSFLTNRNAM